MGQENEEKAELIATIQHDHVAMKTWYNTHSHAKALHPKYGPTYPAFWRDVVNWDGWKACRKLYLQSVERSSKNNSQSKSPATGSNNETNAVPRKRKSRWATTDTSSSNQASPPKRKSRWARGRDPTPVAQPQPSVLGLLPGLPSNLSAEQSAELEKLKKTIRECNAKLENLEKEAARVDALPIGHRDRSPSPPPVYGADGKRKNTRAVRWRERYTDLKQDTLEKMLKLTSGGNAAASVAPSLFNRKRTKKIYIPVDEHPTYNFIGLIIGPRGKTQKEMEGKTGCKIAIRGKGSVKEGARGRRDGKVMEGDNERLHVVVTGESQESVDKAAKMIEDMLVVIDDDKNIHKQAQLRELALLNGTLKDDNEYCPLCAEKGHRQFECPKRFSGSKQAGLQLKCAICGDTSHPTRDCKQKSLPTTENDTAQMDSDYLAFMNELDGKPANATDTTTTAPAIQSLVTSIGPDGKPIGGAPLCQPVVPAVEKKEPPVSTGSLITTISSRVVKASETAPDEESEVIPGAVPNPPLPSVPAVLPPPVPPATLPPATLPPPPAGVPPTQQYYAQPPLPPQPPQQQYYQQQAQYGYGGYQQGAQGYQQQQMYQQGQQGYQNQQNGWNYNNYYGNNDNNNSGGSGFNWWDANE